MKIDCHGCGELIENGERTAQVRHGWAYSAPPADGEPAEHFSLNNGVVHNYHRECFHERFGDGEPERRPNARLIDANEVSGANVSETPDHDPRGDGGDDGVLGGEEALREAISDEADPADDDLLEALGYGPRDPCTCGRDEACSECPEWKRRLDAVERQANKPEGRIDDIVSTIQRMQERLGDLEQQVDSNAEQFNRRLNNLDSYASDANGERHNFNERLSNMEEWVDQIDEQLDNVDELAFRTAERTDDLEDRLDGFYRRLERVSGSLATLVSDRSEDE